MIERRVRRGLPFKGLMMLAVGRADGLREFGGDADSYLTSLAPFLALILVGAGITALAGEWRPALLLLLREVCLLLAPAVVAELFCRLWRRTALWARYATVLNWSLWLQVMLLTLLYAVLLAAHGGVLPGLLALALTAATPLYLLVFHWFLARKALSISHPRVALLLFVNLVVGVAILAASLYGTSPAALRRAIEAPTPANGSEL